MFRINQILLSQPSVQCELRLCSLCVSLENHQNGYPFSEFDPSRVSIGDGNISVVMLLHQNAAHVAPTWERNTSASGRWEP
jgi:hypothetical protein